MLELFAITYHRALLVQDDNETASGKLFTLAELAGMVPIVRQLAFSLCWKVSAEGRAARLRNTLCEILTMLDEKKYDPSFRITHDEIVAFCLRVLSASSVSCTVLSLLCLCV